jgi:hypothetical protein
MTIKDTWPAAAGWEVDCLAYDPFSGDFGDPEERILSDKIVTTRKQRKCCICFGNIKPKTRAGPKSRH